MTGPLAGNQLAASVIGSDVEAIGAARRYAEAIADEVIERDRSGSVPVEALAALDASGLLGITVPAEHGGADVSPVTLAEVVRVIAAVDPAIAQVPQGHFLFADVLAGWGTATQQRRLFADMLAGARFGSGLAERGGRHAQDLRTRLRTDGDGLRLDGIKYYCTGSITARWIGVTALDESGRLVLVFVERHAPGVTVDDDWDVMGQRATVSGTTMLRDVLVDPDLVIPYHQAFEGPQQLGARAQLVHAAIQVGIAGGALRDAGAFVRDRARPFFEAARGGWVETAAQDPHTILRYGRLATRVRAAEQLLAWAAGELHEIGRRPQDARAAARGSLAVAQAKAFGSEIAAEVASDLFALSGASATDERHDLSRHWRNARTHASHDPVDWKYHHVGNFHLNDALPPNHGQI
ncbi:SfnB family sulfur acquisition oxidoreductase [Frankia sp. AgB1.9]|uniref:SfnB family sulfur acquisition oxidoreductase n=1 Tax=unclassified Frankia TaxID=2632575 RepID=UPI0019317C97|nr:MULTISPECIES: SfnB family sulfur acquisition oxidoreductase [unclassified Frankia]MBL7489658.1 SfnB family sulfur acquisition oxidoreductase [Frankia sp. AgW1.1]MBL7548624.1 SfnB family sulfur acquisition oxidoreductase [Frankia sp. AgB1.9]MBL7621576.1 SfnB family sulfur acquisition oxidoreductase [Frankia sp. AgB1.8]